MGENIGMSTDIGKYGLSSKMPAWFLVVCSIVWSWRVFFCVETRVFVTKLPRSGWRARRGVWDRRTASSSYPQRRPGVRPIARLVGGSCCSWCRGEKGAGRGANTANTVQLDSGDFHETEQNDFWNAWCHLRRILNKVVKNKLWPPDQ